MVAVVAKMAVGILLWAGCLILSLVAGIAEIVIQFIAGCIIVLVSLAAFFGLILWLFTL